MGRIIRIVVPNLPDITGLFSAAFLIHGHIQRSYGFSAVTETRYNRRWCSTLPVTGCSRSPAQGRSKSIAACINDITHKAAQ